MPSLALAFSGLLWGLWWLPLRNLESLDIRGFWASLLVFGLCAVLTLPVALRRPWPRGSSAAALLAMGLMSGISMCLWNYALLTGSVVRVTLLFYLAPVWGTLFGFLFFGIPLRGVRLLTIVLGFAGAGVLLGIENLEAAPLSVADGAALASSIAFALMAAYSRRLGPEVTGWQKTFVAALAAALVALPLLALPVGGGPGPGWPTLAGALPALLICMVWQVLLTWLIMWGSGHVEPGRVTILLLLEVVGAVVSASILTDEPFGWREAAGCVLIVGAGLIEGLAELRLARAPAPAVSARIAVDPPPR
jgi:drug/metabolite transporter (DMT)-like permease